MALNIKNKQAPPILGNYIFDLLFLLLGFLERSGYPHSSAFIAKDLFAARVGCRSELWQNAAATCNSARYQILRTSELRTRLSSDSRLSVLCHSLANTAAARTSDPILREETGDYC